MKTLLIEKLKGIGLTDWIAIYAAVVASIALGWEIVSSIRRGRRKIRVSLQRYSADYVFPNIISKADSLDEEPPVLPVKFIVTSITDNKFVIEKAAVQIFKESLIKKTIDLEGNPIKYPIHLEPYFPSAIYYDLKYLLNISNHLISLPSKWKKAPKWFSEYQIRFRAKHLRVRLAITNTDGKVYYSKGWRLQEFEEMVELYNEMNDLVKIEVKSRIENQ